MKTSHVRAPKSPAKSWILAEMLAERPCYPEAQVRVLYATRKRLTLQVPVADRLWVAHRSNACTHAQYAAWCERFVTRAVQRHINSPIPAVATWAQRWIRGEDRSETAAAVAVRAAGTGTLSGAGVKGAWCTLWLGLLLRCEGREGDTMTAKTTQRYSVMVTRTVIQSARCIVMAAGVHDAEQQITAIVEGKHGTAKLAAFDDALDWSDGEVEGPIDVDYGGTALESER